MTDRRNRVGVFSATSLVIASMVGAGVYTTSGFLLADLGSPGWVLFAWFIGGIVALCGAVCYGSLARRFCESGGEYLFLSRAIHPAAGWMAGCVSLLAGFTGATAFAATALEAYVVPEGIRPDWLPTGAIAICAVLFGALLHAYRVGPGARFQNVLVVVKFGMLLLLLVIAGTKFPDGWAGLQIAQADPAPTFSVFAFAMSLMWISLSYSGFNAAVYIAGEIEGGREKVPQALFWGTLLVFLLYLALNSVFLFAPEPAQIAGQADVAVIAANALGGALPDGSSTWLTPFVRSLIVVSLLTSILAMMMSGPRVYAKMAEDGLFPAWFRSGSHGPRAAIWLQAILAIVAISISELRDLLSYLGFTLSVSAALTASTIFLLRRREGAEAMPVPGYPFTPLVFVGGTLLFATLAAIREPRECVAGVATLLCGIVLYLLMPKRCSQESSQNCSVENHQTESVGGVSDGDLVE